MTCSCSCLVTYAVSVSPNRYEDFKFDECFGLGERLLIIEKEGCAICAFCIVQLFRLLL